MLRSTNSKRYDEYSLNDFRYRYTSGTVQSNGYNIIDNISSISSSCIRSIKVRPEDNRITLTDKIQDFRQQV